MSCDVYKELSVLQNKKAGLLEAPHACMPRAGFQLPTKFSGDLCHLECLKSRGCAQAEFEHISEALEILGCCSSCKTHTSCPLTRKL